VRRLPLEPGADTVPIATVDSEGRLVLPAEVTRRLGLRPGTRVPLDPETDSYRLRRPVEQLAKIYVEPTSRCNLTCRTCIRNAWEEPPGDMSEEIFARLLEGLRAFDPVPAVFFGGFGEPLAHSSIVEMVGRVKALGSPKVELITNGCLLNEDMSRRLIEAGLDTLWVSLDGMRPENYADIRLGALLPEVLANLQTFNEVRESFHVARLSPADRTIYEAQRWSCYYSQPSPALSPQLGIAFVAMRRNIADLPAVLSEGRKLGATQFLVSNVLPYTKGLVPEILYQDSFGMTPLPTLWHDSVRLPPMEMTETTRGPLWTATSGYDWSFADSDASGVTRRCPFIEAGSTAVTWEGNISPCLALMHTHTEFFSSQERQIRRHVIGNLAQHDLADIWLEPDYAAFRSRVQHFDFAPCVACGGCNTSSTNEEDCEDDVFPRCGACLWSHGLIRCP
jgi:MoaA/NifB/PqqE/SkfB family radical SAM enzyme